MRETFRARCTSSEPRVGVLAGTRLSNDRLTFRLISRLQGLKAEESTELEPSIFLLQDDNEIIELKPSGYESEAILQSLVAKYPQQLLGEHMSHETPRRWLLVSPEYGVPSEEMGGNRWALDHLFLDQDGIPTLVEVKRSSDTRIRREVVGQMLEYASNGVVYWPPAQIQAQYEASCRTKGEDPETSLAEHFGLEVEYDAFWDSVATNLRAGRIRMLFVADEIPAELRRMVEFLNGQMQASEVLAVEVKQYSSGGHKTLVPRVIGLTAEAERKKLAAAHPWGEARFFEELAPVASASEQSLARDLLQYGNEDERLAVKWGRGRTWGSFTVATPGRSGLSL